VWMHGVTEAMQYWLYRPRDHMQDCLISSWPAVGSERANFTHVFEKCHWRTSVAESRGRLASHDRVDLISTRRNPAVILLGPVTLWCPSTILRIFADCGLRLECGRYRGASVFWRLKISKSKDCILGSLCAAGATCIRCDSMSIRSEIDLCCVMHNHPWEHIQDRHVEAAFSCYQNMEITNLSLNHSIFPIWRTNSLGFDCRRDPGSIRICTIRPRLCCINNIAHPSIRNVSTGKINQNAFQMVEITIWRFVWEELTTISSVESPLTCTDRIVWSPTVERERYLYMKLRLTDAGMKPRAVHDTIEFFPMLNFRWTISNRFSVI
jgi:hypothetical protein